MSYAKDSEFSRYYFYNFYTLNMCKSMNVSVHMHTIHSTFVSCMTSLTINRQVITSCSFNNSL